MRVRRLVIAVAAVTAVLLPLPPGAGAAPSPQPSWQLLPSAGSANLRSIAAVSRSVVWLGSDDGTVVRTTDGGGTWIDVSPTDTAGLHVRGIDAWDATHAVAVTSGGGPDSRVYVTSDGGGTWRMTYRASDSAAFFDDIAWADRRHGLIIGDPVGGRFQVFRTSDGGAHWQLLPNSGMPAAQPDEYGFADSGTTVAYVGQEAWFGSGGSVSRVWHSTDRGLTWQATPVPIQHGSPDGTAGVYGLAVRGGRGVLAVGGNFLDADNASNVATYLTGAGWQEPLDPPSGERFAAAWLPRTPATAVAVGINGSDITYDGARTWTTFDTHAFNTIGCTDEGACFAAGNSGDVAMLRDRSTPYRIAGGLHGALGSTIGPDGALYLPEGVTGTVARVDRHTGRRTTWASGLPKRVVQIGGAMDVAFLGRTAYALVTMVSPDLGGTAADGIYRIDGNGATTLVADIGAWSLAHPPVPAFFIPTGVQFSMQPYRGGFLVTDGHHNRVLQVTLDGAIHEVLTLNDVVPTGLARNGRTVYLSEAGPVPHLPQNGRVLTLDLATHTAKPIASGAPLLVDVEHGTGNQLYALSQGVFTPGHPEGSPADPNTGSLLRVNPDGSMTPIAVGLDRPTSIEIVGQTAYVVTLADEVWAIALP